MGGVDVSGPIPVVIEMCVYCVVVVTLMFLRILTHPTPPHPTRRTSRLLFLGLLSLVSSVSLSLSLLQVELATLQHRMTRLIRPAGDELELMHLDQQRGGIGIMAGGGESYLELQRRTLRARETWLKRQLEKVSERRKTQRRSRTLPVVALVGYTNAGKSSLFNKLTRSAAAAVDDALFATLDPKMRSVYLPKLQATCLLADTVGFVQDLPHALVKAFSSTLEEVLGADIVVHVQDASLPAGVAALHAATVHQVLGELGMRFIRINGALPSLCNDDDDDHDAPGRVLLVQGTTRLTVSSGAWPWPEHTPLLEIWNKSDVVTTAATTTEGAESVMAVTAGRKEAGGGGNDLHVSAVTGFGLVSLVDQISSSLILTGADRKVLQVIPSYREGGDL